MLDNFSPTVTPSMKGGIRDRVSIMCSILISVIIPVYNVRPYLPESLNSVMNQTYRNLEIIIIDDGSTDGSGQLCDYYANIDKRIKVVHQENKGLSNARNVGLSMRSGDAVAFLDSDDVYHPEYVEKMVNAMIRDNVDMVVCKYSIHEIADKNKYIKWGRKLPGIKAGIYNNYEAIQALYYHKLNFSVWNKLYRTNLWDKIVFPDGHVYEDIVVAYKIIELCTAISVINDSLYIYRKHSESISTTLSMDNFKDQFFARSCLEEFVRSKVPELFTEKQLNETLDTSIIASIRIYLYCSNQNNDEWRLFSGDIRKRIIDKSLAHKIHDYRINILIQIIRFCPWMLQTVYSIYYPFRGMSGKFLKR